MKHKIFKAIIALSVCISLIFFSCKKEADDVYPSDPVQITLTSDQISLIRSENSFAFDIFRKVIEKSGESENIIISPLSISYALSMTLNGANGITRIAMLEALKVKGLTPEEINNSYHNLSEELLSVDKRVLITIANAAWIENNFAVKKQFIDILTGFYNAESKSFDITNPLAPKQINSWIESKTNGLIKNMIEKLNENTVMLLINAIYFKGKWKSQFDPEKTVLGQFYKPGGVTSEVPMMKQISDFSIYSGEGFVLAEFPYGQGNFVMDIILPDKKIGIEGILQILNEDNFKVWLNKMAKRETDLSLPRFKYGYKKQLKDVLTTLGMGIAFTDRADFSNISELALLINDVTHQAFIETNEDGTEAAAATIVDISLTSIPLTPFVLNIDRTFLFIIREISTNSILFIGKVSDPLAN